MIPHRMLSNEIGCSGLRERVTACRKRLRVTRATHKAHALNEANDLFPEIVPAVLEVQNYLTEIPTTALVEPGRADANKRGGLNESEALRLTEGQEVGIT
jgi:hypothetical protein